VSIAGGRRVTRWTCESIIEKIAEWHALHGEPPCSADWNPSLARWRAQEWRVERYYAGHWPSTNAVKRAFGGSFDAAVREAGFEPARPGPRRAAGAARPAVPQRAPQAPVPRADAAPAEPAAVALADAEAHAASLERRLAAAERRAERAESRLHEARKRARLATDRASRARRTRDRALDEADARVRAALDQAEAAVRDAEALRTTGVTGAGPAGPAPLGIALRHLASARATGDRHGLRRALGEVAATALRWRDRL
jgi:hypothetical protein